MGSGYTSSDEMLIPQRYIKYCRASWCIEPSVFVSFVPLYMCEAKDRRSLTNLLADNLLMAIAHKEIRTHTSKVSQINMTNAMCTVNQT